MNKPPIIKKNQETVLKEIDNMLQFLSNDEIEKLFSQERINKIYRQIKIKTLRKSTIFKQAAGLVKNRDENEIRQKLQIEENLTIIIIFLYSQCNNVLI